MEPPSKRDLWVGAVSSTLVNGAVSHHDSGSDIKLGSRRHKGLAFQNQGSMLSMSAYKALKQRIRKGLVPYLWAPEAITLLMSDMGDLLQTNALV